MNQTFGLANMWAQGDAVTRTVAIILLVMSIVSWVIILTKVLALYKVKKMAKEVECFWHAPSFDVALGQMSTDQNPYGDLANSAQEAMQHHNQQSGARSELNQTINASDWLTRCLKISIDKSVGGLQQGLTFLASTGATAPFIGLFGTVWGIYHALVGIGTSGTATIDQVAGPIGEALIMTALGLAVAIPAVLGYNAISRINKVLIAELNRFGNDLYAYFITGATVGSSGNTRISSQD
ncbi:MotA/TolQ/ExbB proton channel family protein [Polynucleobacter sp. MWH-CaK5]|uniref:MotA/TolQ/ExbB proton channel family protein n=1 Tax=Polynucleobacter sp. MWH-CaK5 TaxID=2689107 RepID=UPI001BFDB99E|nr:MotA/TolQ/ExbB proton channel family protein [Polynucleobacter sp. MWH-CaK5]QWD89487.1 MotA/TolQ/ExbB proton channel family protein [Polynucleobacter sp. MWH-CaK5]